MKHRNLVVRLYSKNPTIVWGTKHALDSIDNTFILCTNTFFQSVVSCVEYLAVNQKLPLKKYEIFFEDIRSKPSEKNKNPTSDNFLKDVETVQTETYLV